MSAIANLIINDGGSPTLARTFTPINQDKFGTWWFEEQTGSNPLANRRLSIQVVRNGSITQGQTNQDRVCRIKLAIHLPVLEQPHVVGDYIAPMRIAFIPRVNVEFILSERSDLTVRNDARGLMASLLSLPEIESMVKTFSNFY